MPDIRKAALGKLGELGEMPSGDIELEMADADSRGDDAVCNILPGGLLPTSIYVTMSPLPLTLMTPRH